MPTMASGRLLTLALAAAGVSAGIRRTAAGNTALGCNVGDNAGRGFHFADLVKQALPFGQPTLPLSQNASIDAVGWPTQDFSLTLYYEGAGPQSYSYPAALINGTYTITAIGNATVSLAPNLTGSSIVNQTYDASTNSLLAYLYVPNDPSTVGGLLQLSFTGTMRNPSSPGAGAGLVNVSVLQPGYAAGTPPDTFAADALASYAACSLVRVMPWTLAQSAYNPSPPSSVYWSDRARVGMPSYYLGGYGTFGPGMPWEVAASFVNQLGADIWVNIPWGNITSFNASAMDEYIVNLVTMLNNMMPAARKIYVETGNENWNGHFTSYDVNIALSNASVLQQGDPYRLNYGLPTPPNASLYMTWANRHLAYRALRTSQLAATIVGAARVGGASDPNVRVVPILGAQGGYEPQGEIMVDWLAAAWGAPRSLGVATIAIGGYISMGANDSAPELTEEEVIDGFYDVLNATAPTNPGSWCGNPLVSYAALGAFYDMDLHAYEGSPDTSGSHTPTSLMAKAEAVVDPRMQDISQRCVALWQSWGGAGFNWFTAGASSTLAPWGSYSTLYDVRIPDTPKARAVAAIASSPPAPVQAGLPLPVTNHSAALYVGFYSPTCTPPPYGPLTYLPLNETMKYLLRRADASVPCALSVSVYMCNANKTGAAPLEVAVSANTPPVMVTAPAYAGGCPNGNWSASFMPVTASFPPLPGDANGNGLVTLRLRVPVDNADYRILAIDAACQ